MQFTGSDNELLQLAQIREANHPYMLQKVDSALTALWFRSANNRLVIDDVEYVFQENEVIFLTRFHRVEPLFLGDVELLRFNREFYCILDHDQETGCRGLLFFGTALLPRIVIPQPSLERFELFWKTFRYEMETPDHLQLEMLQMMLKRFLILCTRMYRQQNQISELRTESVNLIREFNFLVEMHFRSKHAVKDYASLLHKSPKTLSNLFASIGSKSPLQLINERIVLEARRMLHYSSKTVTEIAFELGYDDVQAFSRFFRKQVGTSPTDFRQDEHSGNIANRSGKSS